MSNWILWGLICILQTAAFTWVSRARNSGSIGYHALASVFSNFIWIMCMWYVVDYLRQAETLGARLLVGGYYTACTVTGAVLMHWVALKYLETGKRKVGA